LVNSFWNPPQLFNKLNKGKDENTHLFFEFFEKQNHGDALHLAVYSAFEEIFVSKVD